MKYTNLQAFAGAAGLCVAGLVLSAGSATAAPKFSIAKSEQLVTVTATGVKLASGDVSSRSDRIEVRIADPSAKARLRVKDKTVKRVEILAGTSSVVSVKLRHGWANTVALARGSRLEATENGFRLAIPRLGYPSLKKSRPAVESATEVAPPPAKQPVKANPAIPPSAEKTTTSGSPAKAPSPVEVTPPVADDKKPPVDSVAAVGANLETDRGVGVGGVFTAALVLSGCAALVWWVRRRRINNIVDDSLDVVASRSLGPKAKVVLINAGERELLLTVTDKGAQLLSQWRRSARDEPLSPRIGDFGMSSEHSHATTSRERAESAVSGILKLKRRIKTPLAYRRTIQGEAAANEDWAHELNTASRYEGMSR